MFGDVESVRCGDVGLVLVCDVWVLVCGDSGVGLLCCVLSVLVFNVWVWAFVCNVWVLVLVCHADPSNPTTSHRVSI